MITFHCPGCEKKIKVADELAGRRMQCAACGMKTRIPELESPEEEIESAREASDDVSEPAKRKRKKRKRQPLFSAFSLGLIAVGLICAGAMGTMIYMHHNPNWWNDLTSATKSLNTKSSNTPTQYTLEEYRKLRQKIASNLSDVADAVSSARDASSAQAAANRINECEHQLAELLSLDRDFWNKGSLTQSEIQQAREATRTTILARIQQLAGGARQLTTRAQLEAVLPAFSQYVSTLERNGGSAGPNAFSNIVGELYDRLNRLR